MERVHVDLDNPGLGRSGAVIRYGHWGRPVMVFPSEAGRAWDYENNGMVDALAPLIDAGRIKLYCVDAADDASWSNRSISLEDRARAHQTYEAWILGAVVPWIGQDSPGASDVIVTGASLGAYHALQFALRRADLFPLAICLSGNYDPSTWHAWGERGDAAYFTNPTDYVPQLSGDHLEWLRSRVHIVLNVGQGAWETHPTRSLPEAHRMAGILRERGISHEIDVWGHDVAHDWDWWRVQIAHHLARFC
ncbi:MAG: alpha/beta hydrolase-fold protein [Mobilicoccus sp.]|nr:alpha/beta hydrolase-fold protein [Mobilicoccus sp.]